MKGKFVRRFVQKRRGVTFMYTRNKEGSVGEWAIEKILGEVEVDEVFTEGDF